MLLSVIIPTHNRSQYAIPTIRAVLAASDQIEVVVSDTSEEDRLSGEFSEEYIREGRLKIIRSDKKLNIVENFELGLQSAAGEYLVFIGDDDFVDGRIIEAVSWAKSEGIDALKIRVSAHYHWPDFQHKRRGSYYAGKIQIIKFSSQATLLSSVAELKKVASDLGSGPQGMPRAYGGIISRELAQRIIDKYGSLFGGVSPDIYSSVLISVESRKSVELDYPVIIPGSSGGSGAGLSASGRHIGGLQDNAYMRAFKNLIWNPLVPEFYSVPTVWSYSFLEALHKVQDVCSVQPNYMRLYIKCFFYHRHYYKKTLRSLLCYYQNVGMKKLFVQLVCAVFLESSWIVGKVFKIVKNRMFPNHCSIIPSLNNSYEAQEALSMFLEEQKRDIYFSS